MVRPFICKGRAKSFPRPPGPPRSEAVFHGRPLFALRKAGGIGKGGKITLPRARLAPGRSHPGNRESRRAGKLRLDKPGPRYIIPPMLFRRTGQAVDPMRPPVRPNGVSYSYYYFGPQAR